MREPTLSKPLIEEKSKGLGRLAPAATEGFSGFEVLLLSERFGFINNENIRDQRIIPIADKLMYTYY